MKGSRRGFLASLLGLLGLATLVPSVTPQVIGTVGELFHTRYGESTRVLLQVDDAGVAFADDLTLPEARYLARATGVTLPENEATHTVDGIKVAVMPVAFAAWFRARPV